jgi:hypothetical protein
MFLSRGAATGSGNILHEEAKGHRLLVHAIPSFLISFAVASFCPRYDFIEIETKNA